MCGGIVLAYSNKKIDTKTSKYRQSINHILYSFGRISMYVLLGIIFGLLGDAFTIGRLSAGVMLVGVGVFMLFVTLSIAGKISFLEVVTELISRYPIYQSSFNRLINANSNSSFYFLGVLNGMLPCGLVYFFGVIAAATASAFWGGFVMLIFGLSTVPTMFGFGFVVTVLQNSTLRKRMQQISALAIFAYAIFTIYTGIQLILYGKSDLALCIV
jgi:sulfite exporter TauE/SafE